MSWTLTKKLDTLVSPGEIKREVVLDPQVNPDEIKSREEELGLRVGLLLHQLFLNSGATDFVFSVETAVAWYSSCYAMASGHCLNIFVFLAAVHGILGLPGWRLRSSLRSVPFSSSLTKQSRFCGR